METHGQGPAVVLAHGFGGSARNWRPQIRALRDAWRVVVYDAVGHARSEAPSHAEAYQPEGLVRDLSRVIRHHAGDAPPVVGGLSMGAGTALRFALAAPAAVRALVLLAPPPGRRPDPDAHGTSDAGRDTAGRREGGRGWARDFADAIERDGLDAAGERYVWGEAAGLDPASGRLVRQGFLEHPPHGLVHLLRNVLDAWPSAADRARALRAFAAPVLLVVGERDRLSRGEADALAGLLPDARLVVAPGAGHVVNLAAPDRVNEALRGFLAGLD